MGNKTELPGQGHGSAISQHTSKYMSELSPRPEKNCQIKPAKISRSTQITCRLVGKKKCLLHATELLWLFITQYYFFNR